MNPWDIAAWAGAITVTIACAVITVSLIAALLKSSKKNPRQ